MLLAHGGLVRARRTSDNLDWQWVLLGIASCIVGNGGRLKNLAANRHAIRSGELVSRVLFPDLNPSTAKKSSDDSLEIQFMARCAASSQPGGDREQHPRQACNRYRRRTIFRSPARRKATSMREDRRRMRAPHQEEQASGPNETGLDHLWLLLDAML